MATTNYGSKYWCVKTDLAEDNEIFVWADSIEITTHGDLILWGGYREDEKNPQIKLKLADPVLICAAHQWNAVYAASAIDYSPVAVDTWKVK